MDMEFSDGCATGWWGYRHLIGVHIDPGDHDESPLPRAGSPGDCRDREDGDLTERYPVGDICAAAVSGPLLGVVGFGPGWRSVASRSHASSVTNR